MVGGVTVQAFDGSSAWSPVMRGGTTLLAACTLLTESRAVSETLTVEASEWVWDKDANLVANVAGEEGVR